MCPSRNRKTESAWIDSFSELCALKYWFQCFLPQMMTSLSLYLSLHLYFYPSFLVFVFVFEISTKIFISPITVNTLLPKLLAVRPGDVFVWFELFARMTSLSLSLWFQRFAPQMMTSLSLSLLFECLASQVMTSVIENLGLESMISVLERRSRTREGPHLELSWGCFEKIYEDPNLM